MPGFFLLLTLSPQSSEPSPKHWARRSILRNAIPKIAGRRDRRIIDFRSSYCRFCGYFRIHYGLCRCFDACWPTRRNSRRSPPERSNIV